LRLRGGLVTSRKALEAEREKQRELQEELRQTRREAREGKAGDGQAGASGGGMERVGSVGRSESVASDGSWKPMCRICYDDEQDGLFVPCQCSGSMGYVHRVCLQKWRAVKVSERGYTHCPMCGYEYKLRSNARHPPSSRAHRIARYLASGECAIISTLVCIVVVVYGELLERLDYASSLERILPFVKLDPKPSMPTSPVPQESLGPKGAEDIILKRVGYNWVCFLSMSASVIAAPFCMGPKTGLTLWERYMQHVTVVGDKGVAISSVLTWLLIYAACEVAFIHLHHYPRAMASTLSLYCAVASVSPFLQWAIQLYVQVREQPADNDVEAYTETSTTATQAPSAPPPPPPPPPEGEVGLAAA